eukprot:jgi/Ulvmu1/4919/UM202_0004.1
MWQKSSLLLLLLATAAGFDTCAAQRAPRMMRPVRGMRPSRGMRQTRGTRPARPTRPPPDLQPPPPLPASQVPTGAPVPDAVGVGQDQDGTGGAMLAPGPAAPADEMGMGPMGPGGVGGVGVPAAVAPADDPTPSTAPMAPPGPAEGTFECAWRTMKCQILGLSLREMSLTSARYSTCGLMQRTGTCGWWTGLTSTATPLAPSRSSTKALGVPCATTALMQLMQASRAGRWDSSAAATSPTHWIDPDLG